MVSSCLFSSCRRRQFSGNCRQTWEVKSERGDRSILSIVSFTHLHFFNKSLFFFLRLSHTHTHTHTHSLAHTLTSTHTHKSLLLENPILTRLSIYQLNRSPCQRRDTTSRDCPPFSDSSLGQPANEQSAIVTNCQNYIFSSFVASCLPAPGSCSSPLPLVGRRFERPLDASLSSSRRSDYNPIQTRLRLSPLCSPPAPHVGFFSSSSEPPRISKI